MDADIIVEPIPLLGLCNLCLNVAAVKSMVIPYIQGNKSELYSDMLLKCFTIDILKIELGDIKPQVCQLCIRRLRDTVEFRNQVVASLKTLEQSAEINSNVKSERNELINLGDDDGDDILNGDDNEDDDVKEALKSVLRKDKRSNNKNIDEFPEVKKEKSKHHEKARTRSSSNKYQKISNKKCKLQEIDAMLKAGLFPFKIRHNGIFSCAICPEKSTKLDDIKVHVVAHSKKNIQAAFKKMVFSMSRFYKLYTKLRCKICTTDVSNYEQLKEHVENCTRLKKIDNRWNNLPFKLEKDQLDCPVCKKTFLNFVSLNTHMNVHYPNYICESCGKAFASKARLRGHMRTHEIGEFPCRYCGLVFDRVTKRENHVSKEHKAGVRYTCKRCNISLTSFYARQKHLAEVHNEELKRYKCKVCTQSYITPGHLSSHVRRDHLNERNHKCDKCDLAFYTKNALKMHMIKHDGERIHACAICDKSYQRKKTLREHMRIHNNDKRFVCPVCGRAFTQKCTLKGHLKVHERKVDIDEQIMAPLHSI